MAGTDADLVAELARAVVAREAPEELPLFPSISAAYLERPKDVERARRGDEPLGFGADFLAASTPWILAIVSPVVSFLLGEAKAALQTEARSAMVDWVKRLFRRPAEEVAPGNETTALSEAQLDKIRAIAMARATELDIPSPRAQLLANAVVGSLVGGGLT